MNMTDPIADMLTRIRNAAGAKHAFMLVPASRMKLSVARILKEEGYIKDFEVVKEQSQKPGPRMIRIWLKYTPAREPAISGLQRISKPGQRVYKGKAEMPRVLNGMGIAIISTSKGIMTERNARRIGLGGEVLCYVW